MPNMDLLIDSTIGNTMFSIMDGFNGYNQIKMAPRDTEKIAFRTPMGNFYYTMMPFGLKIRRRNLSTSNDGHISRHDASGTRELCG